MAGGWTEVTPRLMTALHRLKDQCNREIDRVQVGMDVSEELAARYEAVLALTS